MHVSKCLDISATTVKGRLVEFFLVDVAFEPEPGNFGECLVLLVDVVL